VIFVSIVSGEAPEGSQGVHCRHDLRFQIDPKLRHQVLLVFKVPLLPSTNIRT